MVSFLVASSLVCVCAQRLCRKICSHCKEPVEIPKEIIKKLNLTVKSNAVFYHGKGCDKCRQTGYLGRLGITEILDVDDTVKEMLIKNKSSDEIKKYAIEHKGMVTLWDDIIQKFLDGETTIEEIFRVTTEN